MSCVNDPSYEISTHSGLWHCPETGQYCSSLRARNMASTRNHRIYHRNMTWVLVTGGSGSRVLAAKLEYEAEKRRKYKEQLENERIEREEIDYQEQLKRDQDHEI